MVLVIDSMRMRPPTVDELESEWLSGEDGTMADGLLDPFADPAAVWQAILRIMQCEAARYGELRVLPPLLTRPTNQRLSPALRTRPPLRVQTANRHGKRRTAP